MPPVRRAAIPVLVVAGPRGAGKTTLINRLLADPAFADTAVVLNDFGEAQLAGGLVEKAEDTFVSLGSGCICCAVRGALTDSLETLLRDLDNGRIATIARVVVEADEAADPSAILGGLWAHPYLAIRFAAGTVVTVVDAPRAEALLAARADTVRQVAMADLVALSHTTAEGHPADRVRRLNPFAAIVDAATVEPAVIAGLPGFGSATEAESLQALPPSRDTPLAGEAVRISAFVVSRDRTMPFATLDRLIEYLAVVQGKRLIRVRGLVSVGEGEAVAVSGAGASFRPPIVVQHAGPPSVRFAIVASDVDRNGFERILDAFLGEARIDTPDAAALAGNPLAVPGFTARSGSRSP